MNRWPRAQHAGSKILMAASLDQQGLHFLGVQLAIVHAGHFWAGWYSGSLCADMSRQLVEHWRFCWLSTSRFCWCGSRCMKRHILGVSLLGIVPDWLRNHCALWLIWSLAFLRLINAAACIELVQFGGDKSAMLNFPEGIRTLPSCDLWGADFIFASAHAMSRTVSILFLADPTTLENRSLTMVFAIFSACFAVRRVLRCSRCISHWVWHSGSVLYEGFPLADPVQRLFLNHLYPRFCDSRFS